MTKTYKISFLRQLEHFGLSYLIFLIAPAFFLYYELFMTKISSSMTTSGALIWFLLLWLFGFSAFYFPGLLLHWTYYRNDRKKEIIFTDNFDKLKIEFFDGNHSQVKTIDNIKTIVNIVSYAHNRTPWNDSEYCIFYFDTGEPFRVSCLTISSNRLQKYFDQGIFKVKNVFIAGLWYDINNVR